ncbi:unnamed protein product, partial [Phaeothamnion confervicola]
GLVKHDNHFPSQVSKWTGAAVQQADLPFSFFMTRYADAYKNETKAFCDILKSGGDVSPSGDDGAAALKMAMACDKSLKEGRPVLMSEIKP